MSLSVHAHSTLWVYTICLAVFMEVTFRLGLRLFGVMGIKCACGVNLLGLTR